jgi:hypothetical protein
MHEMMGSELAEQRHEELLREAEMNRHARELRATRRRGTGHRPEIGPGMGDEEASRTAPQASQDLGERRLEHLAKQRHEESETEEWQRRTKRGQSRRQGHHWVTWSGTYGVDWQRVKPTGARME